MAELAGAVSSSVLVLHSTVVVIVVAPHAGSSRHCFWEVGVDVHPPRPWPERRLRSRYACRRA